MDCYNSLIRNFIPAFTLKSSLFRESGFTLDYGSGNPDMDPGSESGMTIEL